MSPYPYFIDVAWSSLNKYNEELCGDKVEIFKSDFKTIIVLADGLGSGVKANILSTLTSKMMITMLRKGIELHEVIDTIASTLPVCSVRKIGYSTFSVIEIDQFLNCMVIEFDNPPVFLLRDNKILDVPKKEIISNGKKIKISEFKLTCGDEMVLCSDGVIHAGVGQVLNHGWEWCHVANFLERQNKKAAKRLNQSLIDACGLLYKGKPGDDTTAITVKVRSPENCHVLTGPPDDNKLDRKIVNEFIGQRGKKVICGGTAGNIVSREIKQEIVTSLDYEDPSIPPTALIKGIDLVTEGVLTLKMTLDGLKAINNNREIPDLERKNGVSQLLKMFVEDSTHIIFLVGHAINPAHQNPGFPVEFSIKTNIIKDIKTELELLGKIVEIKEIDR